MENNMFTNNLLAALTTTLSEAIANSVEDVGLRSSNAAAALVTIMNHPDDSIDVLRRTLQLTHSGAVRLIDSLVSDGLLERRPNTQDARSVVLHVTKLGSVRANEILTARAKTTDDALMSLTDTQRKALEPLLQVMLGSLTQDYDSARRNCKFCNEGICRPQGCPVEQASQS